MTKITITKKIAKQGKNNIIIIPSYLKELFKSGSLVKIELEKINIEEEDGN